MEEIKKEGEEFIIEKKLGGEYFFFSTKKGDLIL